MGGGNKTIGEVNCAKSVEIYTSHGECKIFTFQKERKALKRRD